MSSLIVPVTIIEQIENHPNADRLKIASILGWSVCYSQDDEKKVGEKVVYIPIGCIIPKDLSDKWGVTKYLSKGRVRASKIRGVVSFGFMVSAEDEWEVGTNMADHFGITKWQPPANNNGGNTDVPNELFRVYTEIENIKNFPNLLKEGELVSITEKVHGTNWRGGVVEGVLLAGSHRTIKKRPEDGNSSLYWNPFIRGNKKDNLVSMLKDITLEFKCKSAMVYGELYGPGIQKLHYDASQKEHGLRIFDVSVDGNYLSVTRLSELSKKYELLTVPELYNGPFSMDKVVEVSSGNSTMGDHIKEGVVIKPMEERIDELSNRVILKHISDRYLVKYG